MVGKSGKNQDATGGKTPEPAPSRERRVVSTAPSLSGATTPERKVQELFRTVFRGPVPKDRLEVMQKLNQIVQSKQVEGRTVFELSTRPFTGAATAFGGISVAQGSLYKLAQLSVTEAEELLSGLKPEQLNPSDPDEVEALKAVTIIEYQRLISEFGRGGGPREERIKLLFKALTGYEEPDAKLTDESLLGQIQTMVNKARVITPEDSATLINFGIVKGRLFDNFRAWKAFRDSRGNDFSELAGKYSQNLKLIAQGVTEVEDALDEAGLDVTDREVLEIDGELTLDGLLSWIREFATEEAPQLMDAGGAIGVASTHPTLVALGELVDGLAETDSALPDSENISAALSSLTASLTEAEKIAYDVGKSGGGTAGSGS